MPTLKKPNHTTPRKRAKVESFTDWMARIDASVEAKARQMERKPPTFADMNPCQRRIVQMLIEHMRGLPELAPGTAPGTGEYRTMNIVLTELFRAKYPTWTERTRGGFMDVSALPNGEGVTFYKMLRNSGARAPIEETAGAISSGSEDHDE